MENQPAVVFPSNRRDIKSIQIKHLGMALVGLEARRLRFATPGYFANRRKAESWRISSLSFLSFWVVCACMFGLDICLCVCVFKLTSQRRLHYFNSSPPKPGQTAGSKWAAPIAQRAWPGGPGRFSTRPFPKLRCAPSLPSKQIMERHWHTFCDILLYALGVPTFHIPWPPWEWTPPQSWNDHVAQRWAAAALPVGVVALRRSPRCGNAQWPRCPQL